MAPPLNDDQIAHMNQRFGVLEGQALQFGDRLNNMGDVLRDMHADIRAVAKDVQSVGQRVDRIGLNGHTDKFKALLDGTPDILQVVGALKPLLPVVIAGAERQRENEKFWQTLRLRSGWNGWPGKAFRRVAWLLVGGAITWMYLGNHGHWFPR